MPIEPVLCDLALLMSLFSYIDCIPLSGLIGLRHLPKSLSLYCVLQRSRITCSPPMIAVHLIYGLPPSTLAGISASQCRYHIEIRCLPCRLTGVPQMGCREMLCTPQQLLLPTIFCYPSSAPNMNYPFASARPFPCTLIISVLVSLIMSFSSSSLQAQ